MRHAIQTTNGHFVVNSMEKSNYRVHSYNHVARTAHFVCIVLTGGNMKWKSFRCHYQIHKLFASIITEMNNESNKAN